MTAVSESMVIDAVDQADIPIATAVRDNVFREHVNFRVAHVFVFNSKRELLIQRLALSRKRNPGYWGSSVAAYLFSQEDYPHAAERRLDEELGVQRAGLRFIGKTRMDDDGCVKFISLFTTTDDGPFQFDHQHIDQVRFESIEWIRTSIRAGVVNFTPTFIHVFNFFEASRLEP